MELNDFLDINPYSLNKSEKERLLSPFLMKLSRHHYEQSLHYKKIIDSIHFNIEFEYKFYDLPFIPVRLFKMFELKSVQNESIIKTMTSSGTSGQAVSHIYLDKDTSSSQTKALSKIVSAFIGSKRLPMIIVDSNRIISDRNFFSARGAGILGFSIFGSKRMFALNDKMELNTTELLAFLEKYKSEQILIFGFTFIVYEYLYKQAIKTALKLDLSNTVLIHGGGWKKLISEAVTSEVFRENLKNVFGINHVHDYYGMVEQTGTIYMECSSGNFHAPIFSDIIVRRAHDFSIADVGETGIIQLLSILPKSYPGHSILTEDEGVLLGEDDCACGRLGKYFKVVGRLKNAEIRGCSDTYATK
jgi:phenylacetate-coenzyme A ligase PaaK-like adenylate-forming protein